MRAARRFRPRVDDLEPRALQSAAVAPMFFPPPLLVRGHAEGAVRVSPVIPDVGSRYTLLGSGTMSPLGRVTVRGTIQTTSLTGQPVGTVALLNRFGGVRLTIDGRGPEDNIFAFKVTAATGRYAPLKGTGGVMQLMAPAQPGRGRFALDINSVFVQFPA